MHNLRNLIGRFAGGRYLDALGAFEIGIRNLVHQLRHGRRKQHGLALLWQMRRDLAQRVDKAHVEHLIRLIEHQEMRLFKRERAAIHQVDQTAGRRDKNVDAVLQTLGLHVDRLTTHNQRNLDRCAFGIVFEVLNDLACQFARRRKNKGAHGLWRRATGVFAQQSDQWETKGRRFACARLSKAKNVMAIQRFWDGAGLDRGRCG